MPAAVLAYARVGGVLDFALFEGCDGSDAALREAVALAVERVAGGRVPVHRDALPAPRPRAIGRDAFLGRWCDPAIGALDRHARPARSTGAIVRPGVVTTSDGRRL